MASPLPFHGALGPMQRRLGAFVLVGQAPVIFFGALTLWGLGSAQGAAHAGPVLLVGSILALVSILTAGLLRRPFGVTVGWLVEAAMFAGAILEPLVVVAAAIFLALWITALYQGSRMDALTRAHERRQAASERS